MSAPLNSLNVHVESSDDGEIYEDYPRALTEAIPSLISSHGSRIHTMLVDEGKMIAFRPCNAVDYRAITAFMQGGKDTIFQLHDAQAKAGFNSVVWPEKREFDALADQYPGLPALIGMQAWGLASGVRNTAKKKR